jgi:hypothetical protein
MTQQRQRKKDRKKKALGDRIQTGELLLVIK